MRLINTTSLKLESFMGSGENIPPYAILSHTWGDDEVSFQDCAALTFAIQKRYGFTKIRKTCELAYQDGLQYAWVDTCCIDRASSAELTEAINSMYQWYKDAVVCYVWLSDLTSGIDVPIESPQSPLSNCRWFTRGWTLQELLVPRTVRFYDSQWTFRGTKASLCQTIAGITNIRSSVLQEPDNVRLLSVAQRMSWAAKRETTRVEDMAYCLLGIFDVNMPLVYGEGPRAFLRLQEEIAKNVNDLSLFAWRKLPSPQANHGIFATSPRDFLDSGSISLVQDAVFSPEFEVTNKGLRITADLQGHDNRYLMKLNCCHVADGRLERTGIWLMHRGGGVYSRIRGHEWGIVYRGQASKPTSIFLFRSISALRSQELETSHRGAFMLRENFNEHDDVRYRDFPFEVAMLLPKQSWDPQRRMYFTKGTAEFVGCAEFTLRPYVQEATSLPSAAFLLVFGKEAADEEPWVTIATNKHQAHLLMARRDLSKLGQVARASRQHGVSFMNTRGQEAALVSVRLVDELVDGQMVHVIDLSLKRLVDAHGRACS
ncbi:HET domain protein [Stachybotrys elegans]|uniref:HET domain protein n=1 Tax=Stachybotrys elegans TaxID=80388 RepID=A0A8K0STG1_9HYPO|nr:HET domain protein [Stachybotrys elegans]